MLCFRRYNLMLNIDENQLKLLLEKKRKMLEQKNMME